MYLKQLVIEHNGPIRSLSLLLKFSEAGLPEPLILVGGNGGGKTSFLSTVADALFETAAVHFDNVLQTIGSKRHWFRIVGGGSVSMGAVGNFSLLRFDDAGTTRFFREKAGIIDPDEAKKRVPKEFADQVNWSAEGSLKDFGIDDVNSRRVFKNGAYIYFPSSRSEVPHWLNRDAIPQVAFDTNPSMSKRLDKPIYVEQALEQFKQWLIGVLADARSEFSVQPVEGGSFLWQLQGDPYAAIASASQVLEPCNRVLRDILSDQNASFAWLGRNSSEKVGVRSGAKLILHSLNALSSGQAILLGMFGTLLRYGDIAQAQATLDLDKIEGVCLIDEVDAHIHIDLQYKVLPKLLRLFPRVQFILSSHSPLFVIGMEKEFGSDGMQIIEMPNGTPVSAESYADFQKALDALTATNAFTQKLVAEAGRTKKPIVYVEGETDAPYLKHAAVLLNKPNLLDRCDIEWIGAKDQGGQGFHTGKDALKHTLSVFRANPSLTNRRILLLNDNDSTSPDQDYVGIAVRKLPTNSANGRIKVGIENLLSEKSIEDKFYETTEKNKPNGDVVIAKSLRKAALCDTMCKSGLAEDFAAFA